MSVSGEEQSFDEKDISDFFENSQENAESKNPFKVLREQLRIKEKAVIDQQLALDVKDTNLKDAEHSLKKYDTQISALEAKIRYLYFDRKLNKIV